MNEDIKLLLGYMQQYIDEPNGPDCDGEYPRCWEITTDECECILNYINVLQQENQSLKAKYNKVLTMLANYNPPCELDGFMDKNVEYCSMNCGVDEEVFKECWDRYIDQELKED